jgi:hypothetical protein
MKKFWKWLIGIVLGLLVLAVLVGIPLAMHFWRPAGLEVSRVGPGWGMRGEGYRGDMPMMRGFGDGYRGMPMMHGFGGFGFMPFGGIFGGLLGLGLLALIVVGIVWAVRATRTPRVPMRSCTNCGRAVQEDWKACPYCGKKL